MDVYPLDMLEAMRQFNPIAAAQVVMEDNEQVVLDKNRQQIYDEGIDAQGQRLPSYSGALGGRPSSLAVAYYEEKKSKNPRVSSNPSYDGKDTGETFRTLTLDFQGENYGITPHTSYAEPTLGQDAFGLTEESEGELWEETLKSGIIEAMVEQVGVIAV